MPIYEFRCRTCRILTNVFVRSFSAEITAVCSKCGGTDLTRLISRPFLLKATGDPMEDFDVERSLSRLDDPEDPAAVARWARQVGRDLGDEMGEELRAMADSVEAGEDGFGTEDNPPDIDPG